MCGPNEAHLTVRIKRRFAPQKNKPNTPRDYADTVQSLCEFVSMP